MAASRKTSEQLELFENETIVERGRRVLLWLVRQRDAWISVTEWPGAEIESLEAGPGTVWERRIEISVPRGTMLQRVDSRPAPVRRRDPLDYLAREAQRAPRRVRRSDFRVGTGGELLRVPRPGARARKR